MSRSEPLVAVFGGAGYLGSWVVRLLLQERFRVRVIDNFSFGDEGIRELDSPLLEVIEGDICDTSTVSSATKGADTVILLSAVVGHLEREIKRANIRTINFLASNVVLDAAFEHGVSRFIFASTSSVYGMQSGVMYETGIPEPVSLYSRLKLRMEERVINAKRRTFHTTALRIATCHGYSPRMRFDLVPNALIRDAVTKNEITIQGGDQCRSFIHVSDAARACIACVKAHVNMVSGEVFNVGTSDQNVQISYIANLARTLVPETAISFIEAEPDLVGYRLSCSKIEKVLDFVPQVSLEQSMRELRDLMRKGVFEDPYSLKYSNT